MFSLQKSIAAIRACRMPGIYAAIAGDESKKLTSTMSVHIDISLIKHLMIVVSAKREYIFWAVAHVCIPV